jgi:hypothetical protein
MSQPVLPKFFKNLGIRAAKPGKPFGPITPAVGSKLNAKWMKSAFKRMDGI